MAKPSKKSKKIDWEALESAYRAGMISIRALATAFKMPESTIRHQAKERGWRRDLGDKVRNEVNEELLRSDAASAHPHRDKPKDGEIVSAAALIGVEVVQSHRKDLAQLNSLKRELAGELAEARRNNELYRAIEREGGELKKWEVIMPLNAQAEILERLARVVFRLVPTERIAYNLDAKDGKGDTINGAVFFMPQKQLAAPEVRQIVEPEEDVDT